MGTILLTGATGNVGRPLARMLADAGVPFRAFVRDLERGRAALGPEAGLVRGDLGDPAALEAALEGVERMFLLNGDPGLEGNAIDAAARSGVRRVVKQSALADGLDPPPFHRRVEERLEGSGLGWTHVRPNAFMQTFLAYAPALISGGGVLSLPAGEGRVGWVDVRDIAGVAFRALTEDGHEGRTYAVTGPEALSMADVAREISSATGQNVRYEDTRPADARERLSAKLPAPFAGFLLGFYGAVRESAHDVVTGDVARVTGSPPRPFRAFAHENARAFAGGT